MAVVAKTCRKLPMPEAACEFLSGGEVRPDPRWHMPRHSHPVHELIVILGGRMLLETAAATVRAGPGDLLFYRAGQAHRETSDAREPVNTFFIAFKADDPALAGFTLLMRDPDARVRQMVAWLVRDHQAGTASGALRPLLQALLAEVRRLSGSPPDPWLVELRRHMQLNLGRTVYLEDLARKSRMSKFAFVRKFKRLGGCTPMRELQLMRLNQARAMLLASGLPVKAIAPAVGLNDEYQLAKLFRRHFRLSPRELRARARPAVGVGAEPVRA